MSFIEPKHEIYLYSAWTIESILLSTKAENM